MEVDMLNNNNMAVSPSGDYQNVSKPKVETTHQAKKSQQTQTASSRNAAEYVSEAKYGNENGSVHIRDDAEHEGKGSLEILDKAIDDANKKIMGYSRQFQYSVHEKTKQIMVKIINSDTNEVIKELPPEKTLDAIAKMWELAGILVDEKR